MVAALVGLAGVAPSTALLSGCFADETDVAGLIASQFASMRLTEEHIVDGRCSHEVALNPDTFLSSVRERLGRPIDSVELTRIGLAAGTTVEGVDRWSEVFDNEVTVFFVVAGSPPITAGTLTVPTSGLGQVTGRVRVSRDTLDRFPDIAAGRFSVRLSGSSTGAVTDAFDLPIRVELEFLTF
jgi:hypothetical protein